MNPSLPDHWRTLYSLGQWLMGFLTLVLQSVLEKENFEFKHVKLRLKFDYTPNPASMCRILNRWTNNEELVDIWKHNLCFYSSTVTFVWSRNTVRECSHISFFCGGDHFCEVVRRPENTHKGVELTGLPERPADLCLLSKIADLILCFKSHVFSVYGWLSELTYFCFFR